MMTEKQNELKEAIPALDKVVTFLDEVVKDHPELRKYCFYYIFFLTL